MTDQEPLLVPKQRKHPLSHLLSWLESPLLKSRWFFILFITMAILALIDLIYHRGHAYFELEKMPGFYVAVGFIAFSLIVLSAWPLRIILSRSADYYAKRREND